MQNLINKSKEIFAQLDILGLQKAGIVKEDIKTSSHSHIIVTYPPLDVLAEINPTEIYPLSGSSVPREVALYLHLPFCTGKCLYCAYISLVKQSLDFVDQYLDLIEKEISLLLKSPTLQGVTISSVYIGGGTPTYLSVSQLGRVFRLLRSKFDIKQDAEITIEVGPETVITADGEEKLKALLRNGVNRLSIGFQSFDDNVLRLVGRRHNSKQAIKAYKLAKKAGFENINIDLLAGLPGQTLEIWQSDLGQVGRLKPASITCYPFYLQHKAAIWSIYQKNKEMFPIRETIILMRIMANEFLNSLGYVEKPVYWFSKKQEYVYKQQIHKWGELGEQLALGVSGYSFINDFQYFNFRTVPEYLQSLDSNKLPIWRGVKLSEEYLMRRLIIFGLKVGLNKKLFLSKFKKNPKDVFKKTWAKLESLELIEEEGETIRLSFKGKMFVDEVCHEFYSDEIKTLINKS